MLLNPSKRSLGRLGGECRHLMTSTASKGVIQDIRNKFVWESDLDKRPSAKEIETKDLPPNTPTLGDRIKRDRFNMFWNYDRHSGYYKAESPSALQESWKDLKMIDAFKKETFIVLRNEFKRFYKEDFAPIAVHQYMENGDKKMEWDSADSQVLDDWILTSDSIWGEGYSHCTLKRSPTDKMLWTGELSTRVPNDGRTCFAGYCNIATKYRTKSFFRKGFMEWEDCTHLILRVRGDGREYTLNIHPYREFDLGWFDVFSYPLHTRGGPYWQLVKVSILNYFIHFPILFLIFADSVFKVYFR